MKDLASVFERTLNILENIEHWKDARENYSDEIKEIRKTYRTWRNEQQEPCVTLCRSCGSQLTNDEIAAADILSCCPDRDPVRLFAHPSNVRRISHDEIVNICDKHISTGNSVEAHLVGIAHAIMDACHIKK